MKISRLSGRPFITIEPWPENPRIGVMRLVSVVEDKNLPLGSALVRNYRLVNTPPGEGEIRIARRILKEWFIAEVRRLTGKPEKKFWPHWKCRFKEGL